MLRGAFSLTDLFGSGFSFKMNMQDRIYSWKGGVLSLILILFSIIYTVECVLNLINNIYTNKNVKMFFVNLPEIDISDNHNFMFAYCLGSNHNSSQAHDPIFDNSINYTLRWRYVTKFPYLIKGEVPMKTKKCSLDLFNKSVVNHYDFKYYDGCTCVTPDVLNYNVSYFYSDSYFSFYDFEARFNDTILNNETLYNYIVSYFKNNSPIANFYYVDTIADIDQFIKPFSYYMNFHTQTLNPTSQMISNLYLNNIYMQIDDNVIITSKIYLN